MHRLGGPWGSHLAEQAVHLLTHGTRKLIYIVFKETPAPAVCGLAVVAGTAADLGDGDPQVQEMLVLGIAQELWIR